MTPTGQLRTFPLAAPAGGPSPPMRDAAPSARRRAARSVAWFAAFVLVAHVGLLAALEYGPARLRDPEYGRRLEAAQATAARNPDRPVVLVLGSSRVAMGVRPDVLDGDGRPFALVNFALAGSGPIMERMALHRALADGVTPAAVLIEYFPAFFREDGVYHEADRLDLTRLRATDRTVIRDYFPDPAGTEARMRERARSPWYHHREPLVLQVAPGWLPRTRRTDTIWGEIDEHGWQASKRPLQEADRPRAMAGTTAYYAPLFAAYRISPVADRALRDLVADGRERGLPVALVYLPESAGFRALMPPAAVALADAHLARVRAELNLPLIDGRGWVPGEDPPDGLHLTPSAAAAFTRRLAAEVEVTFPELTR